MMKNGTKLASFALATLLLGTTCATGCKAKEEDLAGKLVIRVADVGNGMEWCVKIAEAFTKETGIPTDVEAKDEILVSTELASGPKNNPVDLYLTNGHYFSILNRGKSFVRDYDYATPMLEITDVYEREVSGYTDKSGNPISIKIKDLLAKNSVEGYRFEKDGKFYSMEYMGNVSGFIYNKAKFDLYGLSVPRTTGELVELCASVRDNTSISEYPIIYAGNNAYWNSAYNYWWVQYDGIDKFQEFFTGKYDGSYERGYLNFGEISEAYMDGRKAAMQVLTDLTRAENKFCDPQSSTYSFTKAQLDFLEGNALIIPTGDWMQKEMSGQFTAEETAGIAMMKMPIVSELGVKLGLTEAKLREIVDYVDGVTTAKPTEVTDDQITAVRDARNLVNRGGGDMFIPIYSDMADEAKDFLQFYFERSSQELLLKYSTTTTSPLNNNYPIDYFDAYEEMTPFIKSKKIVEGANPVVFSQRYNTAIVYAGAVTPFKTDRTPMFDRVLGLPADDQSRMTGIDVYNDTINYYNRETWETMLKNAGLD